MTPTEFLREHAANMQQDTVFKDLPFYQWLESKTDPPVRFVQALVGYYAGHPIRGCFSEDEITNYRYVYAEFWRCRNAAEDAANPERKEHAYD